MRIRRLTVALLGALGLVLSGVAFGPASAGADPEVTNWLQSVGANPADAVQQVGLLNYAGPNCPGIGWNCTGTEKPVIQTAYSLGTNIFECPPAQADCVAVQRGSNDGQSLSAGPFGGVASAAPGDGPNNIAVCNENDSGEQATAAEVQTCVGIDLSQENTTGQNRVVVHQIINQNDEGETVAQSASQRVTITQLNGSGDNDVQLLQKIHQVGKSKGSDQTQLALTFAKIDQTSATGAQNVSSMQDQIQDLKVTGATGAVSQKQNFEGNPSPECGQEHCRNIYLEVNQKSTSGKQDIKTNQSINQFASAAGGTSVDQDQGAQEGGVRAALDQHSSGVSTVDSDQTETQKLDAKTTGALSQSQIGPPLCCPPIGGLSQLDNPNNVTLIKQTGIQDAGPDAIQEKRMTGQQLSSGQTTIDQRVCQNGQCQDFVTGPQTGFVRSEVVCAEQVCTQDTQTSNLQGDTALVEDCSPGIGCTGIPGGGGGECETGSEDCGDMVGPPDGTVSYSQDLSSEVLTIELEVLTALPSTEYKVFLVCGATHALSCGFNTVHTFTTDALGHAATSFSVLPSQFPSQTPEEGCGSVRSDHIDVLKGSGDTTAGLWAATPINYFVPCSGGGGGGGIT